MTSSNSPSLSLPSHDTPSFPQKDLRVVTKLRQGFGANRVTIRGSDALWWVLSLRPGDWIWISWPSRLHQIYGSWFGHEWRLSSDIHPEQDPPDLILDTWAGHDISSIRIPTILRFLGTKKQLSRLNLPPSVQRVHVQNVDLGGALKGGSYLGPV